MYTMILLLFFTTLLSLWLTGQFPQLALRWGLVDEPNQRSAHRVTKPRGAGILFVGSWLLVCLIAALIGQVSWSLLLLFFPGILLIAAVSLVDDRYRLRARTRFAVHVIATLCLLVALGNSLDLNFGVLLLSNRLLTSTLILGACLWSINLFNFMDGTDGIAGVEALFLLGGGGLLLMLAGAHELAWMSWLLCGAVAGFLRWNWPDSRVFMGDVGSAVLGFIVVAFALAGQSYGIPLTLWLILYGVFVFDASITLIRRLLAKNRWYEAHNLHAYQRLCQAGWSHRQLLGAVIIMNFALLAIALWGYYYPSWLWGCLFAALSLLSSAYTYVELKHPMFVVYPIPPQK